MSDDLEVSGPAGCRLGLWCLMSIAIAVAVASLSSVGNGRTEDEPVSLDVAHLPEKWEPGRSRWVEVIGGVPLLQSRIDESLSVDEMTVPSWYYYPIVSAGHEALKDLAEVSNLKGPEAEARTQAAIGRALADCRLICRVKAVRVDKGDVPYITGGGDTLRGILRLEVPEEVRDLIFSKMPEMRGGGVMMIEHSGLNPTTVQSAWICVGVSTVLFALMGLWWRRIGYAPSGESRKMWHTLYHVLWAFTAFGVVVEIFLVLFDI